MPPAPDQAWSQGSPEQLARLFELRNLLANLEAGPRLREVAALGQSLLPALDAHTGHDGPFTAGDLQPYSNAQPPPAQKEALHRRKVMRKARSKKKRPLLLAELERRYKDLP